MPTAQQGNFISGSAQFGTGVVDSAAIAADTIVAADIATNAVGDDEIAAHTTTKITVPFSKVTGTVPLNQGGTGATTQGAAYDALNPNTTRGDITFRNATTNARLAAGTSGQFLKTLGNSADPVWAAAGMSGKTGLTTRAGNAASGDQTIAHGLGVTPKYITIVGIKAFGSTGGETHMFSHGSYDGTNSAVAYYYVNGTTLTSAGDSTNVIVIVDSSGVAQSATATFDATNITLAWTLSGSPNATNIQIVWGAFT